MSTRFRINAIKLSFLQVRHSKCRDEQLLVDAAYFLSQETIRFLAATYVTRKGFIEAFQTYHSDWEMNETVAGLVWDYLQA